MAIYQIKNMIMRSLFSKPATKMYPIIKNEFTEGTRGRVAVTIDDCIFCGMCQRKCPTGAIAVDKNEKTWDINPLSCITCSYCVEVCPKKCLTMENRYSEPVTSK